MSSKMNVTINMENEGSDHETGGMDSNTKAHYLRVKKFFTSASPPILNFERCRYNAGYTFDADGMYLFGFIGARENGTN